VTNPVNLGFLASHNGSNMQAIIDACKSGVLQATPSVVISNNSSSEATTRAGKENIPNYHLSSKTHPGSDELDKAMLKVLQQHNAKLVILAGYMKKLGPRTLTHFKGRVLNIHPALLPKFGGKGMFGRHVHEAVLAAGAAQSGPTVHFVDEEYDHGPVAAHMPVPVRPDDTPDTLAARVLAAEHQIYPRVVAAVAAGRLRVEHGHVVGALDG
jgi:phosphoribosylglycinamide formyltransferase-1